ncbi:MAG: DDE-type integrase/transposase/recombinase [Candidatus Gracilibacteria bacterium]|jgi:transposase InsO family protein
MKGRYGGRYMTTYGYVLPGAASLADWAAKTNITEKAKQRLRVIDWLGSHKDNISLTARHFGLNRETVREWRNKFNHIGMLGLNDKSHKPKNVRKPITNWKTVDEIVKTRKQYPAWSKYKIQSMLERENIIVSASTVGRVLKRKGLIDKKVSKKKSKAAKHPRKRFPKGFRISAAGDMIQMDTKHVNLIGGKRIYQFTAIDVLTKKRVLRYYSSLASKNGADFLEYCLKKFPFRIKAVQTDNGPEFLKHFDILCQKMSIPHYFIYPRQPKQNTYVENSHLADEREFYSQGNVGYDIKSMQKRLEHWEYVWNSIRPHEALGYLTPDEYLNKLQNVTLATKNIIILQT